MSDWKEGLKALLPNINISFSETIAPNTQKPWNTPKHPQTQHPAQPQSQEWIAPITTLADNLGMFPVSQPHVPVGNEQHMTGR